MEKQVNDLDKKQTGFLLYAMTMARFTLLHSEIHVRLEGGFSDWERLKVTQPSAVDHNLHLVLVAI